MTRSVGLLSTAERWVPRVVVGLAVALAASAARPPRDPQNGFHLIAFGQIPVAHQGRVKPLDSLARTSLAAMSGRQSLRVASSDGSEVRIPAVRWLLDVMTRRPAVKDYRMFRIENDQLSGFLGLERREGLRYSLSELGANVAMVGEQAARASEKPAGERDAFEAGALGLATQLGVLSDLQSWDEPHAVPPDAPGRPWRAWPEAVRGAGSTSADPAVRSLSALAAAWSAGDVSRFNSAVAEYRDWLDETRPADARSARIEAWFNHADPFGLARTFALYLVAFLLGCLSWLGAERLLRRTATGLLACALAVHAAGLVVRIDLTGRPPVTNLYSSALFIGFGCVALGLVLERVHGNGAGSLIGSLAGALTLLVAFGLGGGEDTMQVLQAVLDTRFWLATHVVCITLGYTATFVAGLLGGLLILRGVLTRSLDDGTFRSLGRMTYGTVCFATLLSFVGTVLGGIWADQSWGRFWGWDPKENGALMIVLWCALILHARWGGMVRERGVAALSVLGNVVTAWSWFGTNMLGVGLHSYGFMDQAMLWLVLFSLSQAAVAALAAIPLNRWRSFRRALEPALV